MPASDTALDLAALRREALAGTRDDLVLVDRGWLALVLAALTGSSGARAS